ncbi:hypothetical protein K5X82_03305 [Halosquirtibacter xylanolyticus]|uniref:hypothetical protein n=1 Tax=Halosquirtibacter xylanolyticus TaxID=3374599 RepID=UPI003749DA95|nr:hypothetical protein K5X82_03305 [Prolixibacteraceae bacterium]
MRKIITVFLLLYFVSTLSAQTFRSGFVVTTKFDTIRGALAFNNEVADYKIIHFKNAKIDTIFTPLSIQGYNLKTGERFVSRNVMENGVQLPIFAQYLVKGEKSLYSYKPLNDEVFAYGVDGDRIRPIPYSKEIKDIDGRDYFVESKYHVGFLKFFFKDCPEVFPMIDRMDKPRRKSLIYLTDKYHDLTCGENSCVIYTKKNYPIRMLVTPSFMIDGNSAGSSATGSSTYLYLAGCQVAFWLPNESERFYVKTGYFVTFDTSNSPLVNRACQIPLMIEYVFTSKLFMPKVSVGSNFQFIDSNFEMHIQAGAGCFIRMTEKLCLDLNISTDIPLLGGDAKFLHNYVAQAGVCYRIEF